MNITEKFLQGLKATDERRTYRDDKQVGFGVRVEPKAIGGRVSFFWNQKVCGKVLFRSLGEWETNGGKSLKTARDEAGVLAGDAKKWRAAGCPSSANPFQKDKPSTSAAPTFSDLVENYVREHLHDPKAEINDPTKAEKNLRWVINRYFKTWMDRPVDSFTLKDVITLRDSAGAHRYAANRLVQYARALFAWCANDEDGRVPVWPSVSNPAVKVKLSKETKRKRWLKAAELVILEEALDDERTPRDLADFVRLALDTAARKDNILAMKWTEIDWDVRQWNIPMSKSGEPYTVDLLPRAVEILERRRDSRTTSEYVFPATSAKRGYSHQDKPFQRLVRRAGLADLRIHDCRRSAATYMARAGEPLQKIARNLGHSPNNMTSVLIYAELAQEDLPETRQAGADKMREEMAIARKRMERQKQVHPITAGGAK